ncbi:phosphatidate cytidylyltransferase [Corynebacterium halotolerans]|uniref:phosphatidate cytidylyltransferase n=1 Tax=Corynebacterium halotolerans TaxID=225326 RepID=UPI003CE6C7C0
MSEATESDGAKRFLKPRRSAGRDLRAATAVGLVLFALVVIAVIIGPWGWYSLVAVAAALGTWEVCSRLREGGYVIPRTLMIFMGQAMIWLSWPFGTTGLVAAFITAVLALMVGRLFHHGRNTPPKNYLRDTAVGVFVLTWIPMFASFAAMLSLLETHDLPGGYFIITFMLCVIASDIGGYVAGVSFGKHPMAPAVSPKKTWEGLAGSAVFGTVVGSLAVALLLSFHWWVGALLGLLLVVCATLGDLVESQFKRELKIKDMSTLLPGHGGMMDRVDGVLPASMVTWLILSFIGG